MAAGDAAGSACLHPLADGAQVGHILRGPSYCVPALQLRAVEPLTRSDAATAVLKVATLSLVDVLSRYPRATTRDRATAEVMADLDAPLRQSVRR